MTKRLYFAMLGVLLGGEARADVAPSEPIAPARTESAIYRTVEFLVESARGELNACVRRTMRLSVTAHVAANGTAERFELSGERLSPTERQCIERALRRQPPVTPGGPSRVVVSVQLGASCSERCRANLDCLLRCTRGNPSPPPPVLVPQRAPLEDTPARSDIIAAFQWMRPLMAQCAPGVFGIVRLNVHFRSDGSVDSAEVSGITFPSRILQCVVAVARRARVPPFTREEGLRVNYPMRLP